MQVKSKYMLCHYCDTKISPHANFCHVCGEPTSLDMKQSFNICPDCGEKNDSMWAFCEKCEFHFVSGKPENTDKPTPPEFFDNSVPSAEPLVLKTSKRSKVVSIDISKRKLLFPIAFGSLSLIVLITSAVAFTVTDDVMNETQLNEASIKPSTNDDPDTKKIKIKPMEKSRPAKLKTQSSSIVVKAQPIIKTKSPQKLACTPYVVAIKKLNIRQTGSLKGKLVGKYFIGDEVCVSEKKNGWLKTPKGWITQRYVIKE